MAKISARGASEVSRAEVGDTVYVLTSDGRILRKYKGLTGYTVVKRGVSAEFGAKILEKIKQMGGY